MRVRSIGWSCLTLTALLTSAGCSYIANSSSAAVTPGPSGAPSGSTAVAPPAPLAVATAKVPVSQAPPTPSAAATSSGTSSGAGGGAGLDSDKGSLLLDATGAQMTSWNKSASYCPQTTGLVGNGTIATDSTGAVNLTTSGKAGSCVALISPGAYSSGVIEADIDFPALPGKPGTMANWAGFWMTNGPAWPVDGELDGVEVEPVNADNAVTWHSGTRSDEFSASTSGFAPVQLPAAGDNLSPGWHVVDMVYTKGYFAVYYDGEMFTSYTSSNIPGAPLNVYFTMTNTPNTSAIIKLIGSPPVNSSSSPATMSVRYLKVWSYR
jgi:hypothetical protein